MRTIIQRAYQIARIGKELTKIALLICLILLVLKASTWQPSFSIFPSKEAKHARAVFPHFSLDKLIPSPVKPSSDDYTRALIDVIAESEGAQWDICYGGHKANYSVFASYPCPRRTIGKYTSSAFGAFQILDTTYKQHAKGECKRITRDNSQRCQIRAFKSILKSRGLMDEVQRGDISSLQKPLASIWASIDGNPYNQPVAMSFKSFERKFKDRAEHYAKKAG